ncbi:MAG TPA: leucine--tRNA ligase [Burkholderiaceae bacterium]|nr:leucine--tRNA ligase [Burkholderiaceae bacterium]
MHAKYAPAEVEAEAQRHWRETGAYRARENDPRFPLGKFYVCSMLPYPSGKLHMGHVRNYTLNDVLYRILRMRGYNVMTPMGWDAFGLPAENAAIDKGIAPAQWTRANIADMKAQMQPLGLAFDWSREIATCDPSYYRWNQWLFLKMLERGIAYRKTQIVNWDPVDNTVLANEQVIDGRGWRSNAIVEKREIPGYYLAITQYAEELLADLGDLDEWPDKVRVMQENWIGKSVGVNFGFPYDLEARASWRNPPPVSRGRNEADDGVPPQGLLRVFTTRADTIMGVTFVVIAAEHPLATRLARDNPALANFVEECKKGGVAEAELATAEKAGMATGFRVSHPLTGESVEVWIGNYVLMSYGEGAVMGVPGHDERDFAFAKKYGLRIEQVIAVEGESFSTDAWQPWYEDKQRGRCVNSGKYDGLAYSAATDAIAADLNAKGLGDKQVQWRLRDWGISRQRYWGTPIPIIHCAQCGPVPVPEQDLPVVLPEHHIPDGSGNPLNKDAAFLACTCPKCGKPGRRETDTMDTFVDSAWYYMRYCCPDAPTMVDARNDYWMPMDQYIGGIEHAILHLLYARFWTKVMRDLGLVRFNEPFKRLFTQGMLLHESYFRAEENGAQTWFYPHEVEVTHDEKGRTTGAILKADGKPVQLGGTEKMSKSRNNVVEPKQAIAKFGADTARAFVMFAGPPDMSAAWSDASAAGVYRFLNRLWNTCHARQAQVRGAGGVNGTLTPPLMDLRREIHANLKQADFDYNRMQYNTVVSAAMKMLNAIEDAALDDTPASAAVLREGFSILLRTLYPVAPHITHALWGHLGFTRDLGDLLDAPWPQPDAAALARDEIELVVQVNGKVRASIRVAAEAGDDAITATALADANVQKFLEGKPIKFARVLKQRNLMTLAV